MGLKCIDYMGRSKLSGVVLSLVHAPTINEHS